MSKEQIGLIIGGLVIGIAGFWAFSSGVFIGGYAYVCADGTEFRLSPSSDRSSISIHPTKNAAVFPERTLTKVEGEVGSTYVGGPVVIFGKGTDVQLITSASSTVCKPSGNKEPIDWGA